MQFRSLEYVSYVEAKSKTRQYRECKEVFGGLRRGIYIYDTKEAQWAAFKTFTRN